MRGNDIRQPKDGLIFEGDFWFAAHVRPNAERVALANISRQGFRGFLPARMRTTRHARQFRTSIAPLFPGYLFVRLNLGRERWRSINGTFGVVSLVMTGSEPLAVPRGVVETLIEMSTEQGIVQFERTLQPGDKVKVLSGPFAEQLGTLERLDERGRVQVLLQMMGMSIPVISSSSQIAPA